MKTNRTAHSTAGRMTAVVAAGLLTLAASGVASARGGDHGHRGHGKVVQHYYAGHKHHAGRGYHRRPAVVHVYHHGPRVVERHVVVERPVVIERHVVVERPVVVERHVAVGHRQPHYGAYGGGSASPIHAGSLMGAAIGGLIGSQLGGGSGKLAATAAGTLGGFLLGDHTTRGYR